MSDDGTDTAPGAGARRTGVGRAAAAGASRAQDRFATVWNRLAEEYQWVHTLLGVGGNALFFVGSVLFLWESTKVAGVWLFIVGSALMLVGAVGSALLQANEGRGAT